MAAQRPSLRLPQSMRLKQRRDFTERRLMTHYERGLASVGPTCRRDDGRRRGAGSDIGNGTEAPFERKGRLLRAVGGAYEDACGIR